MNIDCQICMRYMSAYLHCTGIFRSQFSADRPGQQLLLQDSGSELGKWANGTSHCAYTVSRPSLASNCVSLQGPCVILDKRRLGRTCCQRPPAPRRKLTLVEGIDLSRFFLFTAVGLRSCRRVFFVWRSSGGALTADRRALKRLETHLHPRHLSIPKVLKHAVRVWQCQSRPLQLRACVGTHAWRLSSP